MITQASAVNEPPLISITNTEAHATERPHITKEELLDTGIRMQTLTYRAPEILWGDRAWGPAVDIWSLGIVLSELAGLPLNQDGGAVHPSSEVDLMVAWFARLGLPETSELTALPHYPKEPPQLRPRPPPFAVAACLGHRGMDHLSHLLTWAPSGRVGAKAALEHEFYHPERARLGGFVRLGAQELADGVREDRLSEPSSHMYRGIRHPWCALTHECAPELLEYLRGDPALTPGTPEHAALGLDFGTAAPAEARGEKARSRARGGKFARTAAGKRRQAQAKGAPPRLVKGALPETLRALGVQKLPGKHMKAEQGRKCIIGGKLAQCATQGMCGLKISKPLPVPRLRVFLEAYRRANAKSIADLDALAKATVAKRQRGKLGANGKQFMDTPAPEYFLPTAELQISNGADRSYGPLWDETRHRDGGASVLHGSLTLWGRRRIRCEQGAPLPDICLECRPGSFYVGALTGPWHQVHHMETPAEELLNLPGFGACSVTLQLRSSLFGKTRSRTRNTTPAPGHVFRAMTHAFNQALREQTWRLPTLGEIYEAEGA